MREKGIDVEHYDPFPNMTGGFGAVPMGGDRHVIDDALVADTETRLDEAATYVGHNIPRRTLLAFATAMALAASVVVLRAGEVQIARASYYASAAEGNRNKIETVVPERGLIYDRGGRALVRNVPNFHLAVTPALMPEDPAQRRTLLAKLALLLEIAPRDIELALAGAPNRNNPVIVAENIQYEAAIRAAIEATATPALTLVQGTRRDYVGGAEASSLAHVLGYEGKVAPKDLEDEKYGPLDRIGKTGIEKQYETELRGIVGTRRIEVDARANRRHILAEEPAVPGNDLVLTIDYDLQRVAEQALKESMAKEGAGRGGVIAIAPKTGEILALVSLPSFDANLFSTGVNAQDYRALAENPDNPLLNRAISASLPSGSTFKPIVAAAAIDEGVVNENTSVVSVGGIRFGGWFFPDWKPGGHGVTNLAKAIGESVNTYFYTIGGGAGRIKGLGEDRIADYAKKFWLGSKLGIDLPGEGSGFVPTREWKETARGERWYIGDTYHFSIGQGALLVTPLQIAAATTVFANEGSLMRPHVTRSVIDREGHRIDAKPEILAEHVVSDRAVAAVREGMRYAVTSGSARSLSTLPVTAAAKTGTAQWHSKKNTHAWFTSFAPYEDPEIAITVFIEEGGEGSRAAAPVAKAMYSWYFSERTPKEAN